VTHSSVAVCYSVLQSVAAYDTGAFICVACRVTHSSVVVCYKCVAVCCSI